MRGGNGGRQRAPRMFEPNRALIRLHRWRRCYEIGAWLWLLAFGLCLWLHTNAKDWIRSSEARTQRLEERSEEEVRLSIREMAQTRQDLAHAHGRWMVLETRLQDLLNVREAQQQERRKWTRPLFDWGQP